MKRLLFLLLFVPILFSCQKYEEISLPHLCGDAWILSDYYITVKRSISPVEVIRDQTICINAFGEQSYFGDGVLMKQNYNLTMKDRRFVKGLTTWEFDYNNYSLYINNNINKQYNVEFPRYLRTEYTQMKISNPYYGAETNYTFYTDAIGANYPLKLTLTSPPIVSDLLLSNGMRDKAVTIQVTLIFTR